MAHDVIAQKYSRMYPFLRPWAVSSEKQILKYGKVVFTFSEKDCQLIHDLYSIKAKSTTFFLHPNVINAIPQKEENYYVFFGAWNRVENSEGLEWFIDHVYDKLPKDIHYKVIGGGQMPQEILRKIEKLQNFEYLGFMDDPYPIIANAKAEIASLHMGAGVKVKCVQALACGTPVITYQTGGSVEAVEESGAGAIVERGNVDALAEAIIVMHDFGHRQPLYQCDEKERNLEYLNLYRRAL